MAETPPFHKKKPSSEFATPHETTDISPETLPNSPTESIQAFDQTLKENIRSYGKKYWYFGDLIFRYGKEAIQQMKKSETRQELEGIRDEHLATMTAFNQAFVQMQARIKDKDYAKKIGIQNPSGEIKDYVPDALRNGISNPEKIGVIALYGLLQISNNKKDPENEPTTATERVYAGYLKTVELPKFVKALEQSWT